MHLDKRGITQITNGNYDHVLPSWSPDGEKLAFSSKRENPDKHNNWDIYIKDLEKNSTIKLTQHIGADSDH